VHLSDRMMEIIIEGARYADCNARCAVEICRYCVNYNKIAYHHRDSVAFPSTLSARIIQRRQLARRIVFIGAGESLLVGEARVNDRGRSVKRMIMRGISY
jgi:hypothetical protein